MEECFDSPRHTKASTMCAKWAKADFSCVRWRKSSRARFERRSDCKRCNVLCAPRRKKRKVAIFHSEIQFLKTPESMCRCFNSNFISLRRKRERKCFFNVDDADFSELKGNFRCTYEAVVVVLKVSFDLHLLEIQKAPFGMCLSY